MNKSKKSGQSLVEVVVALGILGVIFTNIVVLVVYGFNLSNASRKRTEAVAMAQKKMTESITLIQHNCPISQDGMTLEINNEQYVDGLEDILNKPEYSIAEQGELSNNMITSDVKVRKPADTGDVDEINGTNGGIINPNKFYIISVKMKWVDKGITYDAFYNLEQLVRIN